MNEYKQYQYLYPPRPESKITPSFIKNFDKGTYIGQPKYNGSCSVLFLNDKGDVEIRNRHNKEFSTGNYKPQYMDFKSAFRGKGWMVLCGELLTKNCVDENGNIGFNQQFIIWDILVYNSKYLLETTVEERLKLLDEIYPTKALKYKYVIDIGIKGVYKAPYFTGNFSEVFEDLTKTDLYEGLVLKRKNGKLERGLVEKNNTGWMVKCRKPHPNYRF